MIRQSSLLLLLCIQTTWLLAQSDLSKQLKEFNRLDSICELSKNENPAALVEQSKQMLEIARKLQVDSLILRANLLQAQALDFMGLFEAALQLDYENLSLAEQTKQCNYQIKFAILIGQIYQVMGNPEKSQEFIRKGKKYAVDCGHYADTIQLNYDIGFNMAMMGDIEGGIKLTEENLKAAREINDEEYIVLGIDNLSNLLAESGEYQKSLDYELELFHLPGAMEDNLGKAQINEHLAEIYVLLQDWDNAQKYQQEAMKYAKLAQMNDWIYECYLLQSKIDEAHGDYKSALKNHEIYTTMKDSVYQAQMESKMAAMGALYDLESKQITIAMLENEQQIKTAQIQQQRILMLVGLLLLVILLLLIRFLNQRKTQKMREAFAHDLLSAQEQERQRISRELHDSVGQNILFVKNRIQRLVPQPDSQLVESVDTALEEVRNIAKGLYPNQLEAYGLIFAVHALCELAQEASGVFISSDLEGIDDKLDKEAKINCYRIIQECINNALKHAGATAIRITSNLSPGKVELVVQDNGKGFDKSLLEAYAARSFGIINMEERIKMLRGKFDLETGANKGSKLIFSIPIRA